MKMFVKFMIFSVVLAMAGPFFMKGSNGQALMNIKDLIPSFNMPTIPGGGKGEITSSVNEASQMLGKQRFYKWKDKNGIWQFSQTPPPEGVDTKAVDVYPDANIIQSMSKDKIANTLGLSKPQSMAQIKTNKKDPLEDMDSGLFPSTIPLDRVPNLINDAKAVQDLMNQRGEQLKNL